MTGARDYDIQIRNEQDFYSGKDVPDRHYAKMSSREADTETGTISFSIAFGSFHPPQKISLSPDEARHIGKTIMNAAAGALPYVPELLKDIHGKFCNVQTDAEKAGHFSRGLSDPFLLNLSVFFQADEIQEAESKGWVRRVVHRVHGAQGVWQLTGEARRTVELKAVML